MHRVDTPGSVDELFQPGNPSIGLGPTQLGADWHNDVQENIVQVILAAGIALVKGSGSQLLAAIAVFITAAREAAIATAAGDATTKADAARTGADAHSDANLVTAKAYAWSPGDMKMRGTNVVEAGWYECDGSLKDRVIDAPLFAAIGTTWGVGDGVTTFPVPNLRGEHPRGADNGRGAVPDSPGHTVGTYLGDQNKAHTHPVPIYGNDAGTSGLATEAQGTAAAPLISTMSEGGAEARGRSAGVLFVIKR